MSSSNFIVIFCILFVIQLKAQDEYEYGEEYSSQRPPSEYRPDSSSCKRFHEAISKSVVECVTKNVLFINMYCTYKCNRNSLKLSNCHRHANTQLDYPHCEDIFCRDANEVTTCNELPFLGHSGYHAGDNSQIMHSNQSKEDLYT